MNPDLQAGPPQPPAPTEYGPPLPPDYKQTSIVMLVVMCLTLPLTCCVFYGLPSFAGMGCALGGLLTSNSVMERYMAGDMDGAWLASARTKRWLIATIIAPFATVFLLIVLSAILFGGLFALGTFVDHAKKR